MVTVGHQNAVRPHGLSYFKVVQGIPDKNDFFRFPGKFRQQDAAGVLFAVGEYVRRPDEVVEKTVQPVLADQDFEGILFGCR